MFEESIEILKAISVPILESIESGITIVDSEGKIADTNGAFLKQTNFSREEILGADFNCLFKESQKQEKEYREKNNSGFNVRDGMILNRNGEKIPVELKEITFNDDQLNIHKVIIWKVLSRSNYNQFIEKELLKLIRKNSENPSLHEYLDYIKSFTGSFLETEGVYFYIKEVNFAKYQFVRELPEDFISNMYEKLKNHGSIINQVIQLNTPVSIEKTAKLQYSSNAVPAQNYVGVPIRIEGELFGVLLVYSYNDKNLFNERNKLLVEVIGVHLENIIQKHLNEERLAKTERDLQEESKIKEEFFKQMPHEIRTPLTSMIGFSDLIKEELPADLTEKYQDYFQNFNRSCDRIIRTVDLILNYAKVSTEKYRPHFEMNDIIDDILLPVKKIYNEKAKAHGLSFKIFDNVTDSEIYCDMYSVKELFIQLVDNAIKYTPEGSVNITVTDSPIGKLEVKISDTGIGISENYKPYIFSPFSQEDKGTTRKYQGNGIGLALVRKFVELNSASIYMESKKGQGTSFIIVFN